MAGKVVVPVVVVIGIAVVDAIDSFLVAVDDIVEEGNDIASYQLWFSEPMGKKHETCDSSLRSSIKAQRWTIFIKNASFLS